MKSIQKEFRFLALLLVCASTLGMGGLWVWDDYSELQEGLEELQNRYMSEHRHLLEDKINNDITYINFKKEHILTDHWHPSSSIRSLRLSDTFRPVGVQPSGRLVRRIKLYCPEGWASCGKIQLFAVIPTHMKV